MRKKKNENNGSVVVVDPEFTLMYEFSMKGLRQGLRHNIIPQKGQLLSEVARLDREIADMRYHLKKMQRFVNSIKATDLYNDLVAQGEMEWKT